MKTKALKILTLTFCLVSVLAFAHPTRVLAEDCPPKEQGVDARASQEAVCNPFPKFFFDLSKVTSRPTGVRAENTFVSLIGFFIGTILSVAALIAVAFIIIGGFRYITAGGDEEGAESGKKTLTNAIIGLVIVILSYTIMIVIYNAVLGDILRTREVKTAPIRQGTPDEGSAPAQSVPTQPETQLGGSEPAGQQVVPGRATESGTEPPGSRRTQPSTTPEEGTAPRGTPVSPP